MENKQKLQVLLELIAIKYAMCTVKIKIIQFIWLTSSEARPPALTRKVTVGVTSTQPRNTEGHKHN